MSALSHQAHEIEADRVHVVASILAEFMGESAN